MLLTGGRGSIARPGASELGVDQLGRLPVEKAPEVADHRAKILSAVESHPLPAPPGLGGAAREDALAPALVRPLAHHQHAQHLDERAAAGRTEHQALELGRARLIGHVSGLSRHAERVERALEESVLPIPKGLRLSSPTSL
eukprot:scaffold4619_cov222-Isochrysis_galbana.AAC.1